MKKMRKLELEIMAVELWWNTFGKPGMSSEADRIHMSKVLFHLKVKMNSEVLKMNKLNK